MPRLMSCALTANQVVDRTKTVTRRLGWWRTARGHRILKQGDRLWLCRKVMGRKPGEPLDRLALVEVFDVRREPLWQIELHDGDVAAEGFPGKSTEWFIRFFCNEMNCRRDTMVTRIEWRYLGTLPSMINAGEFGPVEPSDAAGLGER